MVKVIKILLFLFVFVISLYSQSSKEYCSISYPPFISVNSTFEISLITSKVYKNSDEFEIYLIPGNGIEIKSAEFKSSSLRTKLKIEEVDFEKSSEQTFRAVVDLIDSTLAKGEFFQVIFSLKGENTLASDIEIAGVFKNKNEILGYSKIVEENLVQKDVEPFFTEVDLNFYKPQKYAGRSLQLNTNSFVEFKIPSFDSKYLLSDFWIRLNNSDMSVLSIINENQKNKLFELKYNSFSMFHMTFPNSQLEFSEPKYLSRKMWNHISLIFEKANNKVKLFCNGYLIGSGALSTGTSFDDLKLVFKNDSENKSFNLEQFDLIALNDDISEAFGNKHYSNFVSNSSEVIFSLRFDTSEELSSLLQKKFIEFGGIQLVKSDAPIFTPAPELNISIYKTSYELSWYGAANSLAASYVLEKSSGNNQFEELIKLQSIGDNEKAYTYTDAVEQSAGIVYYRVKQINKDGSIVYSGSVKVGQGALVEPIKVEQNFPNPFNPKTSIMVDLIESSEVEIIIYSLEGREISTIHRGTLEKGIHKFTFDGTELPSGIYLYKVSTPAFTQTRKMILAK